MQLLEEDDNEWSIYVYDFRIQWRFHNIRMSKLWQFEIIHILRIVTIGGSLLNNLNAIWNCEIALELYKPWSDKNENAEDNTATEHQERHQELANITDTN